MTFEIVSTDVPDPSVRDAILKRLVAFNEERGGPPANFRRLALLVRDPATEEVAGGLWGGTAWGWPSWNSCSCQRHCGARASARG